MNVAKRDQTETELAEFAAVLRKFYTQLVSHDTKVVALPSDVANEVLLMVAANAMGLTESTTQA